MVIVNPTLTSQIIPLNGTFTDTKNGNSVTSVSLGPTSAAILASSTSTGFINNSLPVLSGTARVGQTLSVTSGSWSPTPANYYYVWHRCDTSGNNCVHSSTTTNSQTYTVTSGDIGYKLIVQVAPESDWYSAKNSNLSAVVVAGIPGDLDNDGHVNLSDLATLAANFGSTNAIADVDGDGRVDISDAAILLANYGW